MSNTDLRDVSRRQATQLLHHAFNWRGAKKGEYVWEETQLNPFDELIISWEAERPEQGHFLISVSLFTDHHWSEWLDYALWGASDQHTFGLKASDASVKNYQDIVEVLDDVLATGIRIRVQAHQGASLVLLRELHACATNSKLFTVHSGATASERIVLDVPGLSQMTLPEDIKSRCCSPTSTLAVVRYLTQSKNGSLLSFTHGVWDSGFGIYGNWVLNTAEASHVLGSRWHCFVARLSGFDDIYDYLNDGYPVVVSVKGPLVGGALEYEAGHLIVVRGFDPQTQQVLCMDPAFPAEAQTHVSYPLQDFLAAWKRRKGIAYLFYRLS